METIPNLEVIKLEDVCIFLLLICFQILKFNSYFLQLGFLGAGSFAQVRTAKYNNQLVAVKIFNQTHDSKNEVEFNKEVILLRKKHDLVFDLTINLKGK